MEGRRERICFSWQGESAWLLLEQLQVGSGSCREREGLAGGGPVFSEASDEVPVLPTGDLGSGRVGSRGSRDQARAEATLSVC